MSCGTADDEVVTVFAAASLTDALAEVGDAFEAEHGVEVRFSFAGSSSLREQILAGAPADVFVPADPADAAELVEAGLAGSPVDVATNDLVLAVPADDPGAVRGLADLADPGLLVGLCAAEVPCGALAREALAEAGVEPSLDTEEPDVRALLTKLASGDLDVGIVYATDVASTDGRVTAIALPSGIDVEARYVAVELVDARPDADAFVAFLAGERGRSILRSHGFGDP